LENNIDKINWEMLSTNPNPNAIKLLDKYYQEIDMFMLSANPSAIELLQLYYDDIVWYNYEKVWPHYGTGKWVIF
jgi:hypothetical protein